MADEVCPRCNGDRCTDGPRNGLPCTVDGTVTVLESTAANKTFQLSRDCPPFPDTLAGAAALGLPLTTGTSTRLGPHPCTIAGGDLPDDDCGAGICTEGICTACAETTADGTCVAPGGGIQQACCSNRPEVPCFPTGPGTIGRLERRGAAVPPAPPWPDLTYPKTAEGMRMVATFCRAATDSNSLNGAFGLQAPGALILPVTAEWRR